jgi:cell division transport system ATP-binding protein
MHLFEELNKLGTTVVIATHNESIVNEFGRPILRINSGRLETNQQEPTRKNSSEAKLRNIENSYTQRRGQ